jgi:hypothetical protein
MKNNMQENFKEFVTRLSDLDNPIGDLCFDILRDEEFDWNWSAKEVREYIESLPSTYGLYLEDAVKGFLKEFDKFCKE